MIEEKLIIILPTKEEYADICCNFLELFYKNWPECSFQIVVAWIGGGGNYIQLKNKNFTKKEIYFLECQNMLLPEAIVYASKYHKAEYYICMLGDAFIYQKVDDLEIKRILREILDNQIVYCNLIPKPKVWFRKYQDYNEYARFINYCDRYSHSFIAFLASHKFIEAEFTGGMSDLDFEKKYLKISNNAGKGFYSDRIILKKNIFHIVHGIEKGKWSQRAYALIKKNNFPINLAEREQTDRIKSIIFGLASNVRDRLPNPIRKGIKRIIMIFYKGFTTEL